MGEVLAQELFALVEREQGRAHISDGIGVMHDHQIIELASRCRRHHAECVRLLTAFLKKHDRRPTEEKTR